MYDLEEETVLGFNTFLESQKAIEEEALVTTVLFNQDYKIIHDRQDLREVKHLTNSDYKAEGFTAHLDALGTTIEMIYASQENSESTKTLFVIITDGQENSSREYGYDAIKDLINKRKLGGWEFVFLAANMDSVEEGVRFGIDPDKAMNFEANSSGVASNFVIMKNVVMDYREDKGISLERAKGKLDKDK